MDIWLLLLDTRGCSMRGGTITNCIIKRYYAYRWAKTTAILMIVAYGWYSADICSIRSLVFDAYLHSLRERMGLICFNDYSKKVPRDQSVILKPDTN